MTIQPIRSTAAANNSTQSQTHLGADTKEKREKQKQDTGIDWYCNNCNRHFAVPEPVKRRFHPIDGLYECKVPNCPYCASENIINNRKDKQEDDVWARSI